MAKQRLPQSAPKPGSYSAGSAEQAANRAEAVPASRSPGAAGSERNTLTSRQPGAKGPFQQSKATDMSEWWSTTRPSKPDLMR